MSIIVETDHSVRLTLVPNPFEGARTQRETSLLPLGGRPLVEVLPERVRRDPAWVVVQNGRLIPREQWAAICAAQGGELVCFPRPADDVGKIVLGAVLVLASFAVPALWAGAPAWLSSGLLLVGAGLAVGGAANLIIGPPKLPSLSLGRGDQEGSPTYGFNGIRNSTRLGAPIPVVYGEHRVGGQYLQLFARTEADNDVLYALLGLSEGEIDSITSVTINGQPSANYRDLTTETRLGTNTQTAIPLFGDQTVTAFAADAAITEAALIYTTVGTNLTAIEVLLLFPQGLYTVNDDGTLGQASVTIKTQYRLVGAGSWTAAPDTTWTDSKRATLRRTIRIDGLASGQYDIQLWRTSPESTSTRRVDAVRRGTVNEIVNDGYRYPHLALLAVKALATDQISGGLPTITAVVRGVKVKIFSSVSQFIVGWSDNPAWIVFDMLTNPRYGMGQFTWPILYQTGAVSVTLNSAVVTGSGTAWLANLRKDMKIMLPSDGRVLTVSTVDSDTQCTATALYGGLSQSGLSYEAHRDDLDIQSFIDWAAFCDALVSNGNGGTEKRATCSIVFDADNQKIWDAVLKICGLGLATVVKLGTYLRIRFQQAESPAQLFTMANIVRGSFAEEFLSLKERANVFEVSFLNAANNYEQEMVTLEDPLLFTNSEQERKQTISVYGCTRSSQAARVARFHQLSNRYMTRTIQFEVGIDAIGCEPGDVIRFQHDVPQWGDLGTRAAAGSGAGTLLLDAPVTLDNGVTYQVLVRHSADDTVETQTITSPAGTYAAGAALSIAPATWAALPVDGDVAAIGRVTPGAVKPFRIVEISRTNDFHVRVSAIEYDARIYDETGQIPVNVVNYSTLPDPSAPPAHVTDLTLSQLDDATQTVWVSFTPPTDSRFQTAKIYRTDSGRPVLVGESSTGHVGLASVPVGQTITVKVVSVSRWGSAADFNAAPSASLTVKTAALPPNVTGLELWGQGHNTSFVGRDAKFQWKDRARTSGFGTEPLGQETLGAGAGGVDPFFKSYRVEITNTDGTTLRRREYVVDPLYIYSYEKNYEDGQRIGGGVVRSFTLNVWQQDTFNQLSARPALLTVSNPAPPLLNNVILTTFRKGLLLEWDPPTEPDALGVKVWLSTTTGFTPDDAVNLVGRVAVPGTVLPMEDVDPGTTYYLKAAAYDTFGETGLNLSAQLSGTPTAITTVDIADNAITTPKLIASAVTADKIAALAVIAGKIAAGAVTANEIAAVTILAANIAANAITSDKLTAGAVVAGKIAANAITAAGAEIADATIGTAKIALLNITTALLNDLSVTTAKIGALAVTDAKINDLTADKITAGTLAAARLSAAIAYITASAQIANAVITNAHVNDLSADKITAGTLAAARLSAAIAYITDAAMLASAVVTNAKIGSAAITEAKINDLEIGTLKIKGANISVSGSATAASGSVTASTEATVASFNLTTGAAAASVKVHGAIQGRCNSGGVRTWTIKIKQGATVLHQWEIPDSTFNDATNDKLFAALTGDITQAASTTATYALTVTQSAGGGTFTYKNAIVSAQGIMR